METIAVSQEARYIPRIGENMDFVVDALQREPERPLNDSEKEALFAFENDLLSGVYRASSGDLEVAYLPDGKSILEVTDSYDSSANRHELSLDYFLTDSGKEALRSVGVIVDEDCSTEKIAHFMRRYAFDIGAEELKQLSVRSEENVASQLIEAVSEDRPIEDPTRIVVYSDTANLFMRADGFFTYRRFLTRIQKLEDEHDDKLSNLAFARSAVIEMYKKRASAEIATLYPELLHVWGQAEEMDEVFRAITHQTLQKINPPISRLGPRFVANGRPIAVMLDRLRNGSSGQEYGGDTYRSYGPRSAVSEAVAALFDQQADRFEVLPGSEPEFTPEEIDQLDLVKFDADQMQQFCKSILGALGKLSTEPESTFTPDRRQHAQDGLWQVVVRRDKATSAMGAEEPEGILEIPAKFKRGMTKATAPVGVIPGAAHEITHIYQNDNARSAGGSLALASKLKGKRSLVMMESGAKLTERIIQARLFGRELPDSPHYTRAIQAIEVGAGEVEAIKTFYDSYRQQNPNSDPKDAASVAVSRVKRLIRRKGGFDSQALNYAETSVISSAAMKLPESVRNVLFSQAAFDTDDYVTLHNFDLLPQAVQPFPIEQYIKLVTPMLRAMLTERSEI